MILILQQLLTDDDVPWQLHNCKLSQARAVFDQPLPFLVHYDNLDEETKAQCLLNFTQLKHMHNMMSAEDAANLLGIDAALIRRAWQVKYTGKMVMFCQPLGLAIRVQFSNTSKPAQVLIAASKARAWESQAQAWRAFGVVDVFYKGQMPLLSIAGDGTGYDRLPIAAASVYQSLPSDHSLVTLEIINEHQARFAWLAAALMERLPN